MYCAATSFKYIYSFTTQTQNTLACTKTSLHAHTLLTLHGLPEQRMLWRFENN